MRRSLRRASNCKSGKDRPDFRSVAHPAEANSLIVCCVALPGNPTPSSLMLKWRRCGSIRKKIRTREACACMTVDVHQRFLVMRSNAVRTPSSADLWSPTHRNVMCRPVLLAKFNASECSVARLWSPISAGYQNASDLISWSMRSTVSWISSISSWWVQSASVRLSRATLSRRATRSCPAESCNSWPTAHFRPREYAAVRRIEGRWRRAQGRCGVFLDP